LSLATSGYSKDISLRQECLRICLYMSKRSLAEVQIGQSKQDKNSAENNTVWSKGIL